MRYTCNLRDQAGNEAHAATSIPRRLMLLDEELLRDSNEHGRILCHELMHFAWVRLGNPKRREWEGIIAAEIQRNEPGEAGWSAEWRKGRLNDADVSRRSRKWREYCCEAFCDTGAWMWTANGSELTLSDRQQRRRAAWFMATERFAI